jgi:hypothetical protein
VSRNRIKDAAPLTAILVQVGSTDSKFSKPTDRLQLFCKETILAALAAAGMDPAERDALLGAYTSTGRGIAPAHAKHSSIGFQRNMHFGLVLNCFWPNSVRALRRREI